MTPDRTARRGPRRRAVLGAALAGTAVSLTAAPAADPADATRRRPRAPRDGGLPDLRAPAVVAHRGACGYRPEHTAGAYRLGLDLGADMIEQDVVPTKDGRLVCRHENEIGGTTDVADHPRFADRRTTKTVDGARVTGWFTEDFTLAELKTLRATERLPDRRPHNTLYDGRWSVPTYDEVLDWAAEQGERRGRPVRLCTETKHSTYFRSLGLGVEEPLADLLRRHGLDHADSRVVLQSFEPASVRRLARLVDNPRILLLAEADSRPADLAADDDPRTTADLITPEGLRRIARYAQGIGPTLDLVVPRGDDDRLGRPSSLVDDAHDAGLLVYGYTLRNENAFLPADFRRGDDPRGHGDVFGAARAYFRTGLDAVFADHPDTALLAAGDFRRRAES
ncbi:glycerophosphodiester phosphodiesterase [Streptomyces avicenniae]|uniref:glycerophosphodiester phosphodiesterase n=1 Tax=Streptomyces avicenniae TaxID=500153 RepID=UPI00069C78B2|nr:glycerophosphodiester phosphodiesterase [Streptomyces avicenniae]